MKIRLIINVAVDTKAHAEQIYNSLKNNVNWFGQVCDDEEAIIEFHKCYHDAETYGPCEILEQWKNGVVTWHNGVPVP